MSGPNTYIYEVKGISLSERKDPHTGIKRKPQTLLMAARHNLREIQAENGADYGKLDATRTHLNELLAGPYKASEVVSLNHKLFTSVGKDPAKERKDHVQASEHVLSLAPGQVERGFFSVMVECFKGIYGADKILSATVHRDQDQPHIHILVSPISGGRYHGGKLHNNIQTKSNKAQIAKAAKLIGFEPPLTWKVRKQQTSEKEAAVIAYFEHHQHPVLNDPAWPAWLKTISKDPNPLFEHYGLDTAKIPKSIAQERLRGGRSAGGSNDRYLPSVGIGTPPHALAHQNTIEIEHIVRVRECDFKPENYDPITGEFYNPPPAKLSARQQADRWVSDALGKST
jgi:Plasmid recombination enzyme